MIDMLVAQSGLDENTIINLLPFVLIEIRNYTHQYFLTKHHLNIEKIEEGTIYVNGTIGTEVQVGDVIELMNSENNVLLYTISDLDLDNNTINVDQDLIDETNNNYIEVIKLSFRNVNLKTISNMLKYDNEFGSANGIKSQSLGGYSVQYERPQNGDTFYPIELYGGINSLRKVDDGYSEYRRKGYVRL